MAARSVNSGCGSLQLLTALMMDHALNQKELAHRSPRARLPLVGVGPLVEGY